VRFQPPEINGWTFDESPVCSPDQKWVYYVGDGHISRVPLDGSKRAEAIFGIPQGYQLFPDSADWLDVSPDGNRLAIALGR